MYYGKISVIDTKFFRNKYPGSKDRQFDAQRQPAGDLYRPSERYQRDAGVLEGGHRRERNKTRRC